MNLGLRLLSIAIGLSTSFALYAQTPQTCSDSQVSLQVLGSGGPELDDGRAPSTYLIWHQSKAKVMENAGPGSSVNFGTASGNIAVLEAVLLSHLHVDHSADLPVYAKGAYFSQRRQT